MLLGGQHKISANSTAKPGTNAARDEAKKGCCNGWCSNLKMRYSFSKKASETSRDLVKLKKEGTSYTKLSYTPVAQAIDIIPQEDFKNFASRMRRITEIIEALKDYEINMVGIYGMGGIGKTTLLKQVVQRLKQDKVFDEVAMTVVTQQPNTNKVQKEIAEMLRLDLGGENPIVRADTPRKRLQQGRILVILDDVWAEFDSELQELGFPLRNDNRGCKILCTSQKTSLWELFREKAGEHAEHPELLPIAKDIVNECGRLPLALVIFASALRTICRANNVVSKWRVVLVELRIPCPGNISSGIPANVYRSLQFSYNYLENVAARSFF